MALKTVSGILVFELLQQQQRQQQRKQRQQQQHPLQQRTFILYLPPNRWSVCPQTWHGP